MPKITQFDRQKLVFLHQPGDSQLAISQKLGISQYVFKKNLRKLYKWWKKQEVESLENYLQQISQVKKPLLGRGNEVKKSVVC